MFYLTLPNEFVFRKVSYVFLKNMILFSNILKPFSMLPKAQVVEDTFIPKNIFNESCVAQEGGNLTSRPRLSIAIVDFLAT